MRSDWGTYITYEKNKDRDQKPRFSDEILQKIRAGLHNRHNLFLGRLGAAELPFAGIYQQRHNQRSCKELSVWKDSSDSGLYSGGEFSALVAYRADGSRVHAGQEHEAEKSGEQGDIQTRAGNGLPLL